MEDSKPHSLERNFVDNFGMTLDQFERLDYYDQENIIKKVALLQYKMKKLNKRSKINLNELFTKYPIFTKTIDKRKIFKK